MTDAYVVVGSLLAVLATAVLFLREPKPKQDKLAEEMLRIGQQMKMYKQAAEPSTSVTPSTSSSVPTERSSELPGGRVAILFGSQTGTAEGFAEVLKKEGRKAGFQTHAVDLEDYDAAQQLPHERLVIFVMATYGEGDPTDNAVDFVDFLKDKQQALGDDALRGVHYTVFGLGNTQYEHYNEMGRLVDRLMERHGAQRMFHYGEGDDDATLDEDFDDWKEPLWKALRKQFIAGEEDQQQESGAEKDVDGEMLTAPEYEYELVEIRASEAEKLAGATKDVKMKASTKHFFTASSAKVVVNRELRPSTDGGSTVHVELDLRGTGVTYETADNLAVLAENETRVVQQLAKRLDYDEEQWVSLKPVGEDLNCEYPFPSPCTVGEILTRYLAINSAPRKGPLKQLAFFASDPAERAELVRLASKEGKDEYQKWIHEDERSFVDVLEHFRSVKVSVQALLHIVPFLLPRYYTISSSSLVNPQRVHATVSLIESKKGDGRVFRGVCSNYLGRLQPLEAHTDDKKKRDSRPGEQGSKKPREWPSARIFMRASTFRLPKNPLTPIILIGPGTGIAPMRAFLHERAKQKEDGIEVGKSIMYFGCRRRDEDFIYKDELELFQESGVLSELHLAFSREQNKKVYVQHLLVQNGQATWELVRDHDAYIYVCGATSMGNDVNKVLHEIIEKFGGQSADEALATLKKLQDDHRYIQELWA
ncbi:putative NADPH-cytochrome P450 reductase [Phytophthora cinnamomi]|uniref:putative NADPH-cytochrome P450 reductase n=1 Tax=Phytophthora cinnamomi TaxID=4785 RepID=UPI00355A0A89|nr:putative NADPH-cytochrome P450 reductase [Phytophthora cinnamomi]